MLLLLILTSTDTYTSFPVSLPLLSVILPSTLSYCQAFRHPTAHLGIGMNETYQAKLSGSPPVPPPTVTDEHGQVHFLPNPHSRPDPQSQGQTQTQTQKQGQGQPIPVQLPNIYINPPAPAPVGLPTQHYSDRHQRHREGTTHRQHGHGDDGLQNLPAPVRMIKLGPIRFARPHPLLWISLALSLIALVLEVPKGSLPTLTGRHKVLRVSSIDTLPSPTHFLPASTSSVISRGGEDTDVR